MSLVAGRSVVTLLHERADHLEPICERVLDVLDRWNQSTATEGVLDDETLHGLVGTPVRRVLAACPELGHYAEHVNAIARAAAGRRYILVAGHDDLTGSNVLIDDDTVGFIDWESAVPAHPAQLDAWYFVADAIATADGCTHAVAVEQLRSTSAGAAARLSQRVREASAALGLDAAVGDLLFHAAWLRHADDEIRRGSVDGSFVGVLRALAAVSPGPSTPG